MKHTLIALMEDKPGVLNRVSESVPSPQLQHREPELSATARRRASRA